MNKGTFSSYLKDHPVDILCINETKIDEDSFYQEAIDQKIEDCYAKYWNFSITKKGYSGVGVLSKILPISCKYGIGIEEHDGEGRVVTLEFEDFYLVSVYVPNSGDRASRLPYRTKKWDPDFKSFLENLRKSKSVLLVGDLNVAHKNIDVHDPVSCAKYPGFLPQERKEFNKYFEAGWIDIYRQLNPSQVKYSFFNYFLNKTERTKGLRIDYFLSDQKILERVIHADILEDVKGSDHVPIHLKLKPVEREPNESSEKVQETKDKPENSQSEVKEN